MLADKEERRPEAEAADQENADAGSSLAPTADDWREQLAERAAATMARKAAQRAVRAQMAVRRNHGLAARHSSKRRR